MMANKLFVALLPLLLLLSPTLSKAQESTSPQVADSILVLSERLGHITPDGEDSIFVCDVLHLAKLLSHAGRPSDAIPWGERAMEVSGRLWGHHSKEYALALSDLAGSHSHCGNYDEALRLGVAALSLREELCGSESAAYAESMNNVARYHSYLGNYIDAIILGRKAMELRARLSGKESASYAQSVSNLAGYYSRIGDYTTALRLGHEALDIRERLYGDQSTDYAQSLNNLAKYHYFLGQYEEALRLGLKATDLRGRLLGKHHPDYATALSNLADYYMKTGNHAEALRCGREALEIRLETLGSEHPEYAESLSNMASYHYALGQYSEAVKYGREALILRRQVLGEHHLSYAHSLCKQAAYYSSNNQADSASLCAFEATNRYSESILNTFADLTSEERNLFWMRVKPWFTQTLPRLVWQHPDELMVAGGYNATLLAKGLLLNSEMEMANLLVESGDTTLIEAYHKLQYNQALLTRQYSLPLSKRTINTDSLRRVITKQERHLVKRSKTYGNYTKPLRISWERIHRQLRPHDVVVEFICFPTLDGEEQYAAFVLTRQMSHPTFVSLMTGSQLSSIRSKDIYTTGKLSHLVWEPLAPYLETAHTVYFSPSGELYNIGIESLPHWEEGKGLLMDNLLFYRLSSTREVALAGERKHSTHPSVSIYGGVSYDSDLSETSTTPDHTQKLKGGAKYLPGTRKEAEEISQALTDNDIPTTVQLRSSASEQSFKHLSGQAPSVIHIATHGFYWSDREVLDGGMDERLPFLTSYGNMDDGDKALSRSGLLLAGANHTLTGIKNYQLSDDGVLTAKEISMLDLRGVDLLVLSACQTGLGKITGDGVFGLQRGFKKAGANAILMSLWKVDDRATRLLMTHFYNYLMDGVGKHEALRRAQQALRTTEVEVETRMSSRHAITSRQKRARKTASKRIYDDPYYWAAFILLDGM